jgi:hypothetical protein
MVCLTSLPSHILIDITSYLEKRALKYISPLHSTLKEVCDIHLFHTISLPFSNPYLRSTPVKPYLASTLEGYGWKDDAQQSNHLDASLLYLIPLLKGNEGYVKEISIDLKDRYHDPEIDHDNLTNPTNLLIPSHSMITTPGDKYQDSLSELDQLRIKAFLIRQSDTISPPPPRQYILPTPYPSRSSKIEVDDIRIFPRLPPLPFPLTSKYHRIGFGAT